MNDLHLLIPLPTDAGVRGIHISFPIPMSAQDWDLMNEVLEEMRTGVLGAGPAADEESER